MTKVKKENEQAFAIHNVSMSDCPMCFNSSGFTLYMGRSSQKCEDCKGTGKVSNAKLKRLKKQYGDLIHSCQRLQVRAGFLLINSTKL